MAQLDSKRRSYVHTVRDWPRGTRKRGWGFLHDQVWFPKIAHNPHLAFDRKRVRKFDGVWYELYLDRKMFWWPLGTFRIHTFCLGDDDAAPHDHPWWFITFPLRSYTETVQTVAPPHPRQGISRKDWRPEIVMNSRVVRAWRFHFRSAHHRHFVHEPGRPFTTLILTGRVKNNWSFFPEGLRVKHREWTNYNREVEM